MALHAVRAAFQPTDDASEAFRQAFAAVYRGWSVLPCHAGNKLPDAPLLREATGSTAWKPFQERQATLRELQQWQAADAFGVVTGALSGVVVLDIDPGGLNSLQGRHLPETVTAHTPRGGFHFYFAHPGGHVRTCSGLLPNVDVRGDGGYALLPGTVGRAWAAGLSPEEVPLAPLPSWLAELVAGEAPRKRKHSARLPLPEPRSSFTPPAETFADAPRVLRGLRGDALTAWFRDEAAVLRMAAVLGIETENVSTGFHDVLPSPRPDKNPSASLYRNRAGVWVYRSWRLPGQQFFYLCDVRASQAYRRPVRLCHTDEEGHITRIQPEGAVWSIRLQVEAGLVKPAAVPHKPLPDTAPARVVKLYEGFLLLLGCKWLHTPGAPSPFAWTFAAAWCGVSERHAGDAIKWLLKHGYIHSTGKYKRTALFLPCEVKSG